MFQDKVNKLHMCVCIFIFGLPLVPQMVKNACNAGDQGLIPGLGRSAREENGYPLHYSYLENSMDRVARWALYLEREHKRNIECVCMCVLCHK